MRPWRPYRIVYRHRLWAHKTGYVNAKWATHEDRHWFLRRSTMKCEYDHVSTAQIMFTFAEYMGSTGDGWSLLVWVRWIWTTQTLLTKKIGFFRPNFSTPSLMMLVRRVIMPAYTHYQYVLNIDVSSSRTISIAPQNEILRWTMSRFKTDF